MITLDASVIICMFINKEMDAFVDMNIIATGFDLDVTTKEGYHITHKVNPR